MDLHLIVPKPETEFQWNSNEQEKFNKMGKEGWAATLHVEASST